MRNHKKKKESKNDSSKSLYAPPKDKMIRSSKNKAVKK